MFLFLPPRDILHDIREFRGLERARNIEKCKLELGEERLCSLYTHERDNPLPFRDIFSDEFSDSGLITLIVEDIISYLERSSHQYAEPAKSVDRRLILHPSEDRSDEERSRYESSCFLIVETDDVFLLHAHMVREDITDLSTYHPHITDRIRYLRDNSCIPRECETLDPHRLKSVSDEYTCGFSVFFPDGELSTTELIIVHRWEIIMDE